ncbi:MAG TPA: nuclear transport factor 2 family protein [Pyrinomonadaceae bacterium]|nr:nuclear transport factor 2 family protein [Pyrinomonadaceae bacterium]
MRKTALAAAMVAVVSTFAFVQIACQPAADTNRSTLAPPNTNKETVDSAAIETELLRIENDWPRVIKEKDVAAVGRVEADDMIVIYPDGSVGNKAQDLSDISNGALTGDIAMSDLKVKVLDADAAFVTGQTEFKNAKYKTPDGKSMDISGKYRFIDTFARRNGDWKLVAGISTKITAPAASASPTPAASPAAKTSPAASPAVKATPAVKTTPAVKPPPPPVSPAPKATP